jgi:hypothetical protein
LAHSPQLNPIPFPCGRAIVAVKEHRAVSADLEQTEYRSLTPAAVVGLILGLLAPVAFLSPLLVAVPLAGLVFSLMALRQISTSEGAVIGRPAAMAGLILSTICAAAIPAQAVGMRWLANRQAQPFALEWFRLLAEQHPQEAIEMTVAPEGRQVPGPSLINYYSSDETAHQRLQDFVSDRWIRTLLALGDKAKVRFYKDAGFVRLSSGRGQVLQFYAVTFRESPDDEPTTFFMQLQLEKSRSTATSPGGWRLVEYKGGVRPDQ